MLAASAATFGVQDAVHCALAAIGPVAVAATLPRLQPSALTSRTRVAVKSTNCLPELRREMQSVTAVEATMIAGLTSAGMTSATATAAVILFRLAAFWLPLLPGWGAFARPQRSGDI